MIPVIFISRKEYLYIFFYKLLLKKKKKKPGRLRFGFSLAFWLGESLADLGQSANRYFCEQIINERGAD